MIDSLSHLEAIDLCLSHERVRAATAKPGKKRDWHEHNVRMIEREREAEIAFLAARGVMVPATPMLDEILSDDELLSTLAETGAAAP
jgi:hypothetical protein